MRRFLVATTIGLLWTAIFALSLSAQSGPNLQPAPSFTIPPFVPPTGATITVTTGLDNLTDNGDCTLREAIQAANTDAAVDACPAGSGADLILLAPGSYGLSLEGRSEDANTTGDLDIFSSLVISGGGSATTIIDANAIDRVLHILTGTVEIRSVTVQNGRAADGADRGCGVNGDEGCPGESGGGIANTGSTVLVDVVVQRNRSGDGGGNAWSAGDSKEGGGGGGIVNEGSLQMFLCKVDQNETGKGGYQGYQAEGGDGGGILNMAIFIGSDVNVTNNRTERGGLYIKGHAPGGVGGGIANRGTISMNNSWINGNSAKSSGGGIHNSGDVWITLGQILTNSAGYQSGGIHNIGNAWILNSKIGHNIATAGTGGGITNNGNITIEDSAIYRNTAAYWESNGGGLNNLGSASLVNSTVSGNRSGSGFYYSFSPGCCIYPGYDGGGIYNSGSLIIESSTVAYNAAGDGACGGESTTCAKGGSGGGLANNGGAVTIHNSLIAQNGVADGGSGPDCFGIVTSQGPNLIGSADGCTLAGANDDILNQHAWLGSLTDNGGPTLTHALLPYSHALNAGSCTAMDGAPLLTDQRGEPRPQGAGCDLGAFESELSTIPLPEILYLSIIRR